MALASSAGAVSFTTPVQLMGTDGTSATGPSGGEPSIAADPLGHVYVDGPQGIPSGLNGQPGIGFWSSSNDGTSFSPGKYIGSYLGGGDSDVIVAGSPQPNSVFVSDLEAAATEICLSTDFGSTFNSIGPIPDPGKCSQVGPGQAGPSNDRQWLTYDPTSKDMYLTYHEFVSAQPVVFRSDNGGGDQFTGGPCGPIITDPNIEANVPTDITGGTLVARPVVDSKGNLYILFATTTQQQNAAAVQAGQPSGTFSQLYLAVSKDHCQSFTDSTVYDGTAGGTKTNTVQFGDIFNNLAIDGAGNLYVVGVGYVNTPSSTATTWMFSSSDHGQTWQKQPMQLDPTQASSSAYMLPAAVAGPQAGQLAVGYFRTTNGVADPNNTKGQWTYSTAESSDANSASPTFTYTDVNPGHIYHTGEICNLGILCGTVPGGPSDRSLLDFTAVALDPSGCPLFTFAGNSPGSTTSNYVTRQTSDCFSSSGSVASITSSGGASGGSQSGGSSQGGGSSPGGGSSQGAGSQGHGSAPKHHATSKHHTTRKRKKTKKRPKKHHVTRSHKRGRR
jgi:uncharacterized membrane protein YgcG